MNDTWKTPLKEIADPFGSMHKLAEDYAEVPFAEQLAATASASSFAEAYRLILTALSGATKFDDGESADDLLAMEDGATTAAERNVSLFSAAVDYCRGRNTAVKDSAKKNAWQKCQTHLSAWRAAFSDAPGAIATAIVIDELLHETRAPLSVDEAVAVVRREGVANEDSLAEIVRWYLFDIRKKYRKDIEIKVSQVECPKCRGKHDEGAECPHCQRAEKTLGEAKKALSAKRWKDAEDKANEVLGIWKSNADAIEIRDKASSGAEAERKAAEEEVKKANAAIQKAIDSGDFRSARNRVDETARRNLPGFKADEWRQKISQAEAKAKAEKLEADRKKAKEQYEAALNGGRWMEAERCAREREKLGDGKLESYKAEIDQWKAKRREKLEEACTKATGDFKRNFPENLDAAEAALSSAENALKALEKEFRGSSVIGSTRAAIAKGREDVAAKKRANILNELRPVQSLTATGSADGKPTVAISWKPGSGGTQVAKWRLTRLGRNQPFPDIDGTTTRFEDSSADLKVGVEYVYVITPLAETGKNRFSPNEKAAVRSAPAVCLAKLPPDSLRGKGEGEKGAWGAVTLRWSLPSGVDVRSELAKLFLSRADGAIQDLDVTHKGGMFVDESVSVGQSPEYRLSFVLAGKQSGTSSIRVPVEQMRMPEPVRELRAVRLPVGRWLVEWSWPTGMEQALVAPVAGTVTDGAQLESASGALPVTLESYNTGHGIEVFVPPGADGIAVCTFKDRPGGGGRIHSKPETVPVMTHQAQTTVFYGFTPKTGGLFRKPAPATVMIWSDTRILPDLVLVEGRTRRPTRKDDGTVVAEIPKHRADAPERIVLPDTADSDRMKLFLAKPDRDVDRFKISLPVAVPKNLLR